MNKLVISCPPGAVSLMGGRLAGHFLLLIIMGSPVINFFPYDNFEFSQFCRVSKGWWVLQGAAMARSSPPLRNGWKEPAISTEPGLWGPLKGLEELLRCVGPGVSFSAFVTNVADVNESSIRFHC